MKHPGVTVMLALLSVPAFALAEESWTDSIVDSYQTTIAVWEIALEFHCLEDALESWRQSNGGPLPPEAGLDELVQGGYVDEDGITDPWGERYRYLLGTRDGKLHFFLLSAGPDGIHGTKDDLGN